MLLLPLPVLFSAGRLYILALSWHFSAILALWAVQTSIFVFSTAAEIDFCYKPWQCKLIFFLFELPAKS